MSFRTRTIALCLSIAVMLQLLPLNVMATEKEIQVSEDEQNITITAHANETVTVKEKEDSPIEPVAGSLSVVPKVFWINRDYEQNCEITVTNPSNEPKQFYLEADDDKYSDLSYQFIGNGSSDVPMLIAAGESVAVTLSVFAQNAEKNIYYIPITTYVLENSEYVEDAKQSVTLNCELPTLDLSWNLDSSSETSLSLTYTITNNGDKLTDLFVTVSDELKDYVSFSPVISNYELAEGAAVSFTVFPDLAKMKNESIEKLSGKVIAFSAGKTSEKSCDFDTKGQEITATTMGELALRQDGNPFTNFEMQDEFSSKYYNGTEFVDVSDKTKLVEILDEDGFFQYQYESKVNLGDSEEFGDLNFTTNITTQAFEGDSSNYEDGSIITVSTGEVPGNIQIMTETLLSYNEYIALLSESSAEAAPLQLFSIYKAARDNLAEEVLVKSVTDLAIDDIKGKFIEQLTGTDWMEDVYDIFNVAVEGEIVFINNSNPKISNEAKVNYTAIYVMRSILSIGSIAVQFVNPIVGGIFSVLTAPLNVLLDKYEEAVTKEDARLSALYSGYAGHQCTNRGSISAKFYVPDYTKGTKKPSMHASSRMSGNGYVNKQDTNYNMVLNGNPVGTTQNSGLTDVLMTEIPTDHLLPGKENTIVFDYDTSPGSHSVTTDTEITLLYPNDTEIAYIGEPDDLQDIRTKPDFAVYSENIYADDPVIGEGTNLHINVYNTGSRGGWFTIICKDADSGETIYTKENHYLNAFSSEQFTAPWTPQRENTNIEVHLENTSIDLEERDKYVANGNNSGVRDDRNNYAAQSISARKRLVPKVQSIFGDQIYENEPFSVIVNVTQCSDLVDAVFTYDGMKVKAENTGSGETRRYCLYFDEGMPNGKYTVNAEFKYNSSATKVETSYESFEFTVSKRPLIVPDFYVDSYTLLYGKSLDFFVSNIDNLARTEIIVDSGSKAELALTDSTDFVKSYSADMSAYSAGDHSVLINMYYTGYDGKELVKSEKITAKLLSEKESYFTFSLSKSIASANPKFSVYRSSYLKSNVTVDTTENGYRFLKTLDMVNNPSNYQLVVAYDSGVIVKGLDNDGILINDRGCHTLTVVKSETDQITYAAITGLPESEYSSVTIPVSLDAPVTLSPGAYKLCVKGSVDGVSFYRNISIDVSGQDQKIDLNSFALVYYIDTTHTGSSLEEYKAKLCVNNDYGWKYIPLDIGIGAENNILKCYDSYEWDISQVNESMQVYLLVYSKSEVFFIPIKNKSKGVSREKEIIAFDKSALKKVSIKSKNENLSVGRVNIIWNGLSVGLNEDTFYISDGEYELEVELKDGNQMFSSEQTVNISKDCEIIVGDDINVAYSNVTVNWSDVFDTTSILSCYNTSKNWSSSWDVGNADTIKVLDGGCMFRIGLTSRGIPFTFTKEMNVEGNDMSLEIGDELSGDFSALFASDYEVGESIRFSIINVFDKNGNKLFDEYFDTQLNGEIVYTDVENTDKIFTVPIHTDKLYNIYAGLPGESGTYSVDVKLDVEFPKEELVYNVTISDSYADISGAGRYEEGAIVTISAGKRDNYKFAGWISSDVTFNNPSGETTTFIMPAADVSVTAQWKYNGNVLPGPDVPPYPNVPSEPSEPSSPSVSTEPEQPPTTVPSKKTPVDGTNLKVGKAYYNVSKKGTAQYLKPTTKNLKSVTIPSTVKIKGVTYKVTSIADKAFINNKKLKEVIVSDNIITIGNSAFQGCKALKTVTIGKRVRTIGKKAFYGDSKLKTLNVKSTALKKVGVKALYGIHKNAVIKVPKKNLSAYKKLFKNKGQKRTVKIKKR